jgi:cytochrome oxidase Cu insertion factor (SCO1/SenC/PrrC family)
VPATPAPTAGDTAATTQAPAAPSATTTAPEAAPQAPATEGPAAPDFSLDLADGSQFVLSDEQKPVYLVFWAEW